MSNLLAKFIDNKMVAYFSMEIALNDDIHTYSGGLGVLAGDTLKTSADLRLPLIGITLASKKGYFRQELTPNGEQIEHTQEWNPSEFMQLLPQTTDVRIENRKVQIKAWLYTITSPTGGETPIIFLDTDIDGNKDEDKRITDFLYGGDPNYRFKQEIVLGIGGVRMLDALGFTVRKYHMNEGHSSLLGLELLRKTDMNVDKVKKMCIFTTHTPVEAGHDKFSYDLVTQIMNLDISLDAIKELGGKSQLNLTRLALNLSNYVNGVAKEHKETSQKMFPGYKIHAITNGIHSHTWTCENFKKIYDEHLPGWGIEPNRLAQVEVIPDEKIWQAHLQAKKNLIDYVDENTNVHMDPEILTIGFARRSTAYKRAGLIFSDLDKLRKINRSGQIQLIFGGKAHPKDYSGKQIIKEIFGYKDQLKDEIKIAYLQDYDISVASNLIPGVDVWLNTPLPPFEASGTSGMKAAHNGVINFSVLDGWWAEGCLEGVNGWAIGPAPDNNLSDTERKYRELDDLYSKMEYVIAPLFYQHRDQWIKMMKNSIATLAYYFNSHRMLQRYVIEAYFNDPTN
ncbi:MAG: alpha-glucan family phosphorylase [Petrotogales bacterium]